MCISKISQRHSCLFRSSLALPLIVGLASAALGAAALVLHKQLLPGFDSKWAIVSTASGGSVALTALLILGLSCRKPVYQKLSQVEQDAAGKFLASLQQQNSRQEGWELRAQAPSKRSTHSRQVEVTPERVGVPKNQQPIFGKTSVSSENAWGELRMRLALHIPLYTKGLIGNGVWSLGLPK